MDSEKRNELVPTETVLRHVTRELKQAYAKIAYQSQTIKRLQKNIQMLLEDPELKKEVAKEVAVKECKRELAKVGMRLHEARIDREKLLEKYLMLQLRFREQETVA